MIHVYTTADPSNMRLFRAITSRNATCRGATRGHVGFSSAPSCHYLRVKHTCRSQTAGMGNQVDSASAARSYQPQHYAGRETPAPSTLPLQTAICRGPRDRRRSGRVDASGTAIVHRPNALHGRIIDLAIGGISLLVEGGVSQLEVGDRIHVSVRLDGAGLWFRLGGSVARIDACGLTTMLAIALSAVPQDFEDLVQSELLSVLECAYEPQILLVDAARGRRDLVAAAFRAVGARVIEVSSALEAIAEIDQSRLHLWAVVIADTKIASRADDLRSYLRETYPRVPLVIVGGGRRTPAHLTVDRFPDLALQIHSLVAMRDQIGACA